MRFNELKKQDIRYVKGVGERKSAFFNKLNIYSLYDLLNFFPFRYEDRTKLKKINQIHTDEWQSIYGTVLGYDYFKAFGRKRVLKIFVGDDTGHISLICYNRNFLKNILKKEMKVFISSNKFTNKYNELQTSDFDYEIIDSDESETDHIHTKRIVPIYHSTENLSGRFIRTLVFRELKHVISDIKDIIPNHIKKKYKLQDFNKCLYKLHFPADLNEVDVVRRRLAFDRFFFLELILALHKKQITLKEKKQKYDNEVQYNKLLKQLPFSLTDDQNHVLKEILFDLKNNIPMNRLLMGDVGSGKTVVALLAALLGIDNDLQVAFMAPTEILATQHYNNIKNLLLNFNIEVTLLVGKQKVKEKQETLKKIKSGDSHIIVGTHALIEEQVVFHNLGLIIIDEQHRFGVMQRARMHLKADNPDVLVMTATPIPRTLSLTVYGDLDISMIKELPPGRKPIRTLWYKENHLDEVYQFLREEMKKKHQIYVVYPLVKESEKMDLKDAETMYINFCHHIFKDFNIGLIHGQMKKEEKSNIMDDFRNGKLDLLVSTTVIEVGVDVANASVMVIEHAERFGIAQLHQLRGRIGRGDISSTCILITGYKLTQEGRERMKSMVKYNDGFKLAEIDLRLRGPGEIMGTKQTGLPDLKPANLLEDQKILETARKEAFDLIDQDPQLTENTDLKEYLKNESYEGLDLINVS